MALLIADEIIQRHCGRSNELAQFDQSLTTIRRYLAPLANLAKAMAEPVRDHGYESLAAIVRVAMNVFLPHLRMSGKPSISIRSSLCSILKNQISKSFRIG